MEPVSIIVLLEVAAAVVGGVSVVGGVVWKRLNRVEFNLSTRSHELFAKVEDVRILVATMNGHVHGTDARLSSHEQHDQEIHAQISKEIGGLEADVRELRANR